MIYKKYLILIMISNIIILLSCKNHTDITNNNLQYKNYLSAKKKLKNNNYQEAIKELEKLNKKYPLNPYTSQIYLNLIYAYYKSTDFQLTHKTIDNFIKLNPKHKNLDYVLYMRGITNMEIDNANKHRIINKIFNINHSKHNPIYAHNAFYDFSLLIQQYPKSQYVIDAQKRLIYLKNRIAKYELSIIKFYNKKEAYITVIHRTEDMLRYFPDTQATKQALIYMNTAYKKLQLTKQSNKITKIINYNKS